MDRVSGAAILNRVVRDEKLMFRPRPLPSLAQMSNCGLAWHVQEHKEVSVVGSDEEDESEGLLGSGAGHIFSEKGAGRGLGQGCDTCDMKMGQSGARAEVRAPVGRIQMHILPYASVLMYKHHPLIASLWQIRA